MGAALSPMNAFLILQGIETLHLRMERASDNALAIARYLTDHPKVAWVNCAALPDHPDHALLQKYMNGRAPSILSFEVKPAAGVSPRVAGAKMLDAMKLFTRLVNIGDSRSLVTHSASTTHRQLNAEELKKAGVSEGMLRLSIGLEHIDDLIADLDQALAQV
jgi:O-acetylhomoserine (thiol)-lyase